MFLNRLSCWVSFQTIRRLFSNLPNTYSIVTLLHRQALLQDRTTTTIFHNWVRIMRRTDDIWTTISHINEGKAQLTVQRRTIHIYEKFHTGPDRAIVQSTYQLPTPYVMILNYYVYRLCYTNKFIHFTVHRLSGRFMGCYTYFPNYYTCGIKNQNFRWPVGQSP